MWEVLLPGIGTVLIAILSSAGGSALLELYYKPRRDRQTVGKGLLAEVARNTELLILFAYARAREPLAIPANVRTSRLGFEAVIELIREFPVDLLRSIRDVARC